MSKVIEPPFRPRVERLLKAVYPLDRLPIPRYTDTTATWSPDAGEIWSTCGQWDRLVLLVLACHKERIQAAFLSDRDAPGFRVLLASKGFAPTDPAVHHPGLSDLATRCYSVASKQSDDQVEIAHLVGLLRRAQPLVAEALMAYETGENTEADGLAREMDVALKFHPEATP